MSIPNNIKNKAEQKLPDVWAGLSAKEAEYFSLHDKYFQLLATDVTQDGSDGTFVIRHPSDEQWIADAELVYASPIPFRAEVHEWVGTLTKGFKLLVTLFLSSGEEWERIIDSDGGDTDWVQVTHSVI